MSGRSRSIGGCCRPHQRGSLADEEIHSGLAAIAELQHRQLHQLHSTTYITQHRTTKISSHPRLSKWDFCRRNFLARWVGHLDPHIPVAIANPSFDSGTNVALHGCWIDCWLRNQCWRQRDDGMYAILPLNLGSSVNAMAS
jgi:hypothetical protein